MVSNSFSNEAVFVEYEKSSGNKIVTKHNDMLVNTMQLYLAHHCKSLGTAQVFCLKMIQIAKEKSFDKPVYSE